MCLRLKSLKPRLTQFVWRVIRKPTLIRRTEFVLCLWWTLNMDSITSGMFTGDAKTQLTIIFSSKPKVDAFLTYSERSPFWKNWPFFWKNLSVFLTSQPNFEARNFSHFSTRPFNNYSKFSPLEKSFQISYSKSSPYRFSEDFFEIRLFKNLTIESFSNRGIQKTHLLWNVGAYFCWNTLIQAAFKN